MRTIYYTFPHRYHELRGIRSHHTQSYKEIQHYTHSTTRAYRTHIWYMGINMLWVYIKLIAFVLYFVYDFFNEQGHIQFVIYMYIYINIHYMWHMRNAHMHADRSRMCQWRKHKHTQTFTPSILVDFCVNCKGRTVSCIVYIVNIELWGMYKLSHRRRTHDANSDHELENWFYAKKQPSRMCTEDFQPFQESPYRTNCMWVQTFKTHAFRFFVCLRWNLPCFARIWLRDAVRTVTIAKEACVRS